MCFCKSQIHKTQFSTALCSEHQRPFTYVGGNTAIECLTLMLFIVEVPDPDYISYLYFLALYVTRINSVEKLREMEFCT
jgi:hypothetical protein